MSAAPSGYRLASRCLLRRTSPARQFQCQYSSGSSSRSQNALARHDYRPHAITFSTPLQHTVKTVSSKSLSSFFFFPGRRRFSAAVPARHGHLTPPKPGEGLQITIIDQSSVPHTLTVAPGDNVLDIAQAADLEMEGACGGSCACSTCHVIVEDSLFYDRMPEPEDDENDMLDLAFALTETSRLGCQVKMSKELDGLVVRLPSMTRNLQKSDFEEKKGGA